MRAGYLAGLLLLSGIPVLGQTGWMPLSREVERPYTNAVHAVGSPVHAAIRPYRKSEVDALSGVDSLRPTAALVALDRWAGVRNGRKVRWGPLLDATGGYEPDGTGAIYRGGGGLWLDADAGSKLSFHLDGQGWGQRFASYLDTLVRATQVTPGEGYAHGEPDAVTHYDWNAYLSWDPGKYFNFTVGRGRNFLGEGYRSLFLSDEAYSYPYLRITTNVWRIKYVNLFTMMNDIRGADGVAADFNRKYTSMHYLSWNVTKHVNIAVFEAIIWSQGDSLYPRGFDVTYLNPVLFYRPAEYNIGSPDNALLGLAVSGKVGKKTTVYTQFMLDEFLLERVRDGSKWYGNKYGAQVGVRSNDLLGVDGLALRAEWDFVRPFMFTHSDTRQNYAHMAQPLAHPYGSNFHEVLLHVGRDKGRWHYGLRGSMAWLGTDSVYSYGNNIFRPESERPRNALNQPVSFGYSTGDKHQMTLFHGEVHGGWMLDPNTGTRLQASALYRVRTPHEGPVSSTWVFNIGIACHFRDRHPEQEVRYVIP